MPFPTRTVWMGPAFSGPARRIVSLVPSLTEAVFALNAQETLVGRTEWCVRPRGRVEIIETVGGTKNPNMALIRNLRPHVILANKEENRQRHIEDLALEFPIWLTDPLGPEDVPALWEELGRLTDRVEQAAALADRDHAALQRAIDSRPEIEGRPRFLYFVWKDPWMAAGHDTYISNLLEAAGLRNALSEEFRRFPQLTTDQIAEIPRDVTVYSSEPYAFQLPRDLIAPGHVGYKRLSEGWFRVSDGSLAAFVDSEPLSWYPSLTLQGLQSAEGIIKTIHSFHS